VQEIAQLELALPEVVIQPKLAKASKASIDKVLESEDDDLEVSEFLPIPDVPPAANRHLGMHYFIPEWDDHVDPGYDFLNNRLLRVAILMPMKSMLTKSIPLPTMTGFWSRRW
jgi:hypothetical protein